MPKIDTDLASALKQAKSKQMFFVFIAKGADGKLLVSKAKIPAKEIAEAKAAIGGGTVWQGRCQDDDGTLVFQVPKEPPGNLDAVVKKIIARDSGLAMTVAFRLGESEEDESEGDTTTAPSPTVDTAGPMTAIKERIKVLKPQLDARKESDPKTYAALSQKLVTALGSGQAKDFETANSALDEIVAALKGATAPTSGDEAARFTARLKTLSPVLQKAQAVTTPLGQQVKAQTAQMMGLAQKKDFVQANAILDKLAPLLKQALAEAVAGTKQGGAPAPAKTLGIWQQAKDAVDVQITKLASFLRATKEPDYLYLADHGLTAITKRLQVGLIAALMSYDGASGPDREKARVKAQGQVDEFKKFILSDPAVALFDENPFGVSVTLRQTLGQALDDLTRALKA
jgi:hypothetical protein